MSQRGNFSQYAEHIGASGAYVSKLKKQGRLVVVKDDAGRELVDFEMSDRLVRNTTDMGRARNGSNASGGHAPIAPVEPVAAAGRVDAIFRQAQAQERAYNAKIAEIEYRERAGELVRLSDVRAEHSRLLASIREAFLQLPARIVPLLAQDVTPEAIDLTLRREINSALQMLADAE
jgi:phage terminase Nu1 subunit (DNA packaging protein)